MVGDRDGRAVFDNREERVEARVIGVDELGAALARLTVAEVMAEHSPTDAIAQGIGMVFQHFMLADNLTVWENIVLGDEPGKWWKLGTRAHLQQRRSAKTDVRRSFVYRKPGFRRKSRRPCRSRQRIALRRLVQGGASLSFSVFF
jgi:ABC-type sugar transport system ATPase subunit